MYLVRYTSSLYHLILAFFQLLCEATAAISLVSDVSDRQDLQVRKIFMYLSQKDISQRKQYQFARVLMTQRFGAERDKEEKSPTSTIPKVHNMLRAATLS
jgi:hypothetical protein